MGSAVQYFHEVTPDDLTGAYICREARGPTGGPWLLQSHGWLDGRLQQGTLEEAAARCQPLRPETWPVVLLPPGIAFAGRGGRPQASPSTIRVPVARLREPVQGPPLLSLVFVRWGGKYRVGENDEVGADEGEGGWGKYGCPPSDYYMSALVAQGVMAHPRLGCPGAGGAGGPALDFEIFSLFISGSTDAQGIVPLAPRIAAHLKGRSRASFWMLWPAEWEDWEAADYAGYVGTQPLFAAMRACEAAGIRSSFPHPADLYELITSKVWMAMLAAQPEACLPAAVLVTKESFLRDPEAAARDALAALGVVRRRRPSPVPGDQRPWPSAVNKDGIRRGVVKVGWSWEARFVLFFTGEKQLQARLREMLMVPSCLTTVCIVQEWVDFDFEVRLYFLPPANWAPGKRLLPERLEYNGWGPPSQGQPGSFTKLSRAKCLSRWEQDEAALNSATEQAVEASQFLLAWLYAKCPEPVAMVRLDFMLLRVGPGVSRVVFGEFCEMGACCLAWAEGPPRIWRAALDYALR